MLGHPITNEEGIESHQFLLKSISLTNLSPNICILFLNKTDFTLLGKSKFLFDTLLMCTNNCSIIALTQMLPTPSKVNLMQLLHLGEVQHLDP